jgi:hypothetical protein
MDELKMASEYLHIALTHTFHVTSIVIYTTTSVMSWFGCAAMDIVKSERSQKLAIDLLWLHSRGMIQLEKFGQWTYDEFEHVQYCVDHITWLREQIEILTSNAKREPGSDQWVQSCKLVHENNIPKQYFEHYQFISGENAFNLYNDALQSIATTSNSANSMVILKQNEQYLVRLSNTSENLSKEKELNKSEFRPMSISYSHPQMDESIMITLPAGMWYVGNELFSPIFVRRCLEYQNHFFVFDDRYSIQIIDSNVNLYSIGINQYARVQDKTIEFISLSKDELSDSDDEHSEKEDEPSENEDESSEKEDEPSENEDESSEKEDEPSEKEDEPSENEDESSEKEDEPSENEDE